MYVFGDEFSMRVEYVYLVMSLAREWSTCMYLVMSLAREWSTCIW